MLCDWIISLVLEWEHHHRSSAGKWHHLVNFVGTIIGAVHCIAAAVLMAIFRTVFHSGLANISARCDKLRNGHSSHLLEMLFKTTPPCNRHWFMCLFTAETLPTYQLLGIFFTVEFNRTQRREKKTATSFRATTIIIIITTMRYPREKKVSVIVCAWVRYRSHTRWMQQQHNELEPVDDEDPSPPGWPTNWTSRQWTRTDRRPGDGCWLCSLPLRELRDCVPRKKRGSFVCGSLRSTKKMSWAWFILGFPGAIFQ